MEINRIIDQIIIREGGYVNHEDDSGSHTNLGITIDTLSAWLGREATEDEVRNLTKETAKEIYKERYYFDPQINKLPESIQEFVLDCAVNHGPATAIKFVQKSVTRNGYPCGKIDGVVGPKTIRASHKFDRMFLDELIDIRENYYYLIVENSPDQAVFLPGWLEHRVERFRE